jgi:hypothetical protein
MSSCLQWLRSNYSGGSQHSSSAQQHGGLQGLQTGQQQRGQQAPGAAAQQPAGVQQVRWLFKRLCQINGIVGTPRIPRPVAC